MPLQGRGVFFLHFLVHPREKCGLDPQNALAYFLRGMFSADHEEGLKSYLKAIELNPEWKRYYVEAALLADQIPTYKSSKLGLKLWQLAAESAPDDFRVYVGYGNALKSRGRIIEAEALFQRGLAANPNDVETSSASCALYIEQRDIGKLRPACKTAVGLPSAHLEELAWKLNEIKEYALAESAYRKAREKGSDPQHTIELNLARGGLGPLPSGKGAMGLLALTQNPRYNRCKIRRARLNPHQLEKTRPRNTHCSRHARPNVSSANRRRSHEVGTESDCWMSHAAVASRQCETTGPPANLSRPAHLP